MALDAARLSAFYDELAAAGNRRVLLADLWRAFAQAFPRRPEMDERAWLADALRQLEAEGLVRQPAARRGWEDVLAIPLPRWVALTAAAPATLAKGWRAFPWHPHLSWIADLIRLDEHEERFLQKVHESLVAGRFDRKAPAKHRSLALLGREKALEEILGGRLFRTGRLTLELLGCFTDVPPLAWASAGAATGMMIFENQGAFAQARAVLTAAQNEAVGMVGFGDGNRFERSIAYAATIGRPVERMWYVGDLDGAGLAIAGRAAQTAVGCGLPPLKPAPGFHAAMLAAARQLGHEEGWPATAGRARVGGEEGLTAWLPMEVRAQVVAMLRGGRRIPEEVLGPDQMAESMAAMTAQ